MPRQSKLLKTALQLIKEHPEYFEALVGFEKTGKLPETKSKDKSKKD